MSSSVMSSHITARKVTPAVVAIGVSRHQAGTDNGARLAPGPPPHGRLHHTREYTSRGRRAIRGYLRILLDSVLGTPEPSVHLVSGRVVADIPDFCRELVAALAGE